MVFLWRNPVFLLNPFLPPFLLPSYFTDFNFGTCFLTPFLIIPSLYRHSLFYAYRGVRRSGFDALKHIYDGKWYSGCLTKAECYRAVSNTNFVCPNTHQSRRVLYSESAVISAERAWDYFSDFVVRRIQLVERREAERANTQQQYHAWECEAKQDEFTQRHKARERSAQVARERAAQEAQGYHEHKLRIL